MNTNRTIDHIVYAVSDLDTACKEFEKKLGVTPIFGGHHTSEGTKNALINLQDGMYLELIAIDHSNKNSMQNRWMGVDVLTKNQITRFALKSKNLEKDSTILKKYHPAMGGLKNGSRHTASGLVLQWELLMPLPTPEVELIPFVLDWSKSNTHPHELLPNMGCSLVDIYATHPTPEKIRPYFKELAYNLNIEKQEQITLQVTLNTPNGIIHL
ncbi:VOC family protein [uncultured Dokdonia sp.]|uniref:VOC family protein n=1 Tax=uncultured Dokdonia sp. TaxID=575653 RepID=UPI0026061F96|nr:VOC family protein [uncultured Dokdonia sp.]